MWSACWRERKPVGEVARGAAERMGKLIIVLSTIATIVNADPRQFAGPDSPANQSKWLASLNAERDRVLQTINFTGGVFDQVKIVLV